jgi:hypothetical protein
MDNKAAYRISDTRFPSIASLFECAIYEALCLVKFLVSIVPDGFVDLQSKRKGKWNDEKQVCKRRLAHTNRRWVEPGSKDLIEDDSID